MNVRTPVQNPSDADRRAVVTDGLTAGMLGAR